MGEQKIVIIGSGVMGLTLGHLVPGSIIYEKAPFVGGPSRTLEHKGFHFDTGFHFLSPSPEAESFLKKFLGDNLKTFSLSPESFGFLKNGKIYHSFPGPYALWSQIPSLTAFLACLNYYFRKIFPKKGDSFKNKLVNQTGDLFYQRFQKEPIEKLYGIPASQLFFLKQGRRTKKDVFLNRLLRWLARGARPLEKSPFRLVYPFPWFGSIVEKLSEGLDIRTSSELTGIRFSGKRVTSIEINYCEFIPCNSLVSTIPPHSFIRLLHPPTDTLEQARAIRYRSLILVVLFFEAGHVMKELSAAASGKEIFNLAFEPKNLSESTAPPGQTAVCFQIYTSEEDKLWQTPDEELIQKVYSDFNPYYSTPQFFEGVVVRFPNVFPIPDRLFETRVKAVYEFASSFENIYLPSLDYCLTKNSVSYGIQEAIKLSQKIAATEITPV